MKRFLGIAALLLMLAACGDFQWFPDANPNVDTTPDQFKFTDRCSLAINTDAASDAVTITGINAPALISVVGGAYSLDNGITYITTNGSITNKQTVRVRPDGDGKLSATRSTAIITLTVGGVLATYKTTTDACLTGTP
jgi:hypothetical protein